MIGAGREVLCLHEPRGGQQKQSKQNPHLPKLLSVFIPSAAAGHITLILLLHFWRDFLGDSGLEFFRQTGGGQRGRGAFRGHGLRRRGLVGYSLSLSVFQKKKLGFFFGKVKRLVLRIILDL